MLKGLGHPSILFGSAAIAALCLYRILETGFGLGGDTILAASLGSAALIAVPLGFGLVIRPRAK
jgi:hypothetical protein